MLGILQLAGVIVAAAAISLGTDRAAAEGEPVRIGVIQAVTGPFTKNGTENWAAMQIARDMLNERGGIPGHDRSIEFIFADAPTATAAITETERLITSHGVTMTAGSGLSVLAIAVSQAAERHGVFHWETAGGAEVITRRGHRYTFQAAPSARLYAEAAVDFTVEELTKLLGKPLEDLRVALLWENRAFGASVGDNIRAYAPTQGLELIYDEGYDQFLTDMTPIVQQLKDAEPDVLLAISFPNDAVLFQRKARELDFTVGAMVGVSAGYSNPDLRGSIGDMVNGIFVSDFSVEVNPNSLDPEIRPIADEFFERYDQWMGRPPAGHAVAAFSAMWALFTEVLPKATTFEPDELREISLGLDLPPGTLANGGGIKFTNNDWEQDPSDMGQNLRGQVGIWQWQPEGNNQVYPTHLATHEPIMVPLPAWDER